jgi:hypothetical protein
MENGSTELRCIYKTMCDKSDEIYCKNFQSRQTSQKCYHLSLDFKTASLIASTTIF